MRRRHFDQFRPVCPRCRAGGAGAHPLRVSSASVERDGVVIHGILGCCNRACLLEFPIIDGVPIIVPNVRAFVAASLPQIEARDDLPAEIASLLGDCAGPGTAYDVTRYHLSTYAWDHYAEFDPAEATGVTPGSVVRALARARGLAGAVPAGPRLDLGCSVGRATFELAGDGELVLGLDANFSMLRLAQRVGLRGEMAYARRRVGVVYDARRFAWTPPHAANADFWCCDAAALPFEDGVAAAVSALNLLDCVGSPAGAIAEWRRVLRGDGCLMLSTPYDWSAGATPPEQWLGGHSQRGPGAGAPEPVLRRVLREATPGFEVLGEDAAFPWTVRLHDRSTMAYDLHMIAARAAR